MTVAPWPRISIKPIHEGWRYVMQKTFIHPSGREVIADISGQLSTQHVAIIALTPENQVVIARQFRCGPEIIMDDIPGGAVDENEPIEDAVRRELSEETGYVAGSVEYLGKVYGNGWSNEVTHYFMGYDCVPGGQGQQLDSFEVIEVATISIEQLFDNALNAKMSDFGAVLLAHNILTKLKENQS